MQRELDVTPPQPLPLAERGAAATSTRSNAQTDIRTRTRHFVTQNGAAIVLIAVCILGTARYETFLTAENLLNILRQNSMLSLVALGMTGVILTGGIDLSVGSLLALSGIVTASLSGYNAPIAIAGGVATGAALGLINGVMIARVRIQPFIATLAMMIAVRGIALGVTHENSIPVALSNTGLHWLGRGWLGPIPVPVVVFTVVYAIGGMILRYTPFGRRIYATGDDQNAARLLGLDVNETLLFAYMLSGALAGLAGVLLTARLSAGQPVAGAGWELDAIAAVVVGGTMLTGGQGGVGRTLVGVVLLGVILNLLNLEGTLSPWWQSVVRGLFLLIVVVVQGRAQTRSRHG